MPADVEKRTGDRRVGREVVTINEARLIAKVSRRTIYNWMAMKKIVWVYTAGGGVRIFRDTLLPTEKPKP